MQNGTSFQFDMRNMDCEVNFSSCVAIYRLIGISNLSIRKSVYKEEIIPW